MKTRSDFVTNSSSSSFIISKNNISYENLKDLLLEIANEEKKWWDDEGDYTSYDDIAYRYIIIDATPEDPHIVEDDWARRKDTYTNHFIVDNDSLSRYDWDIVEEVLGKHNIPWVMGYCD